MKAAEKKAAAFSLKIKRKLRVEREEKIVKKLKNVMVTLLVVVIGIASLTECGSNDAAKADNTAQTENTGSNETFKIGTANGSLCLVLLHVAQNLGYFEEEFAEAGIPYELVEIDMQQAAELIAAGKIDACVGLSGSLIPQIDSGLEIAFTGGLHTGCTKYYVKADSDIQSLSDLKGKKIGVPGMSDSSVVALKRKLFDLGIGVSTENLEVELIVYNLTDLPLALENGAVDAIALHDPVATSAETEYGFRKILDLTEDEKFADEYCCQIYVSTDAGQNKPLAAAAYTRALLKAAAYVQAQPKEAAKSQIDNNQCSGELEVNAALLDSYNYTPSVKLAKQTFKDASDELIRIGDLTEGRDLDQFTEEHFIEFDNVPESYVYNEDGSFTEVE